MAGYIERSPKKIFVCAKHCKASGMADIGLENLQEDDVNAFLPACQRPQSQLFSGSLSFSCDLPPCFDEEDQGELIEYQWK